MCKAPLMVTMELELSLSHCETVAGGDCACLHLVPSPRVRTSHTSWVLRHKSLTEPDCAPRPHKE
jgi:hypothetical protein